MKSIIAILALSLTAVAFSGTTLPSNEGPGKGEIKQVCTDKKSKDGKSVQECKNIKVRKKLEGTEIPPTTPKK